MNTKTFLTVLGVLAILCALSLVLHFAYAAYAYQHASIIQFIAKELW